MRVSFPSQLAMNSRVSAVQVDAGYFEPIDAVCKFFTGELCVEGYNYNLISLYSQLLGEINIIYNKTKGESTNRNSDNLYNWPY